MKVDNDFGLVLGESQKPIVGRVLVDKSLLVGGIQTDVTSCVYIAALFMAHVCDPKDAYANVSKSVLTDRERFRNVVNLALRSGNVSRRMSNHEAFSYFNDNSTEENRAKKRWEVALEDETSGQTAKRILKDGMLSLLELNGHAFVTVGEADNGNLIVWDTLMGESIHGLREVDPNNKKLDMFFCAKIRPSFHNVSEISVK